jgi:branched-chain amino acid transport system ATP-binding protein
MTSLLRLENISVSYGQVEALDQVSIDVAAGSIVTVIGANGAGKTSLLNAAMGLVPSSGNVVLQGEELRIRPTEQRLARGLALVPERRELFSSMTVYDNLLLGGYLRSRADVRTGLASVYERFLAPRIVADILEIVVALKSSGVSVLLVEQNARAALAIADQAYVMELGKVTLSGPAKSLSDDPRVIESYLGLAQQPITLDD